MKEISTNELSYVSGGLSIDMLVSPGFVSSVDGMGSAAWFANTYYPLTVVTMVALIAASGTVIVGSLYIVTSLFSR